MAERMQSPRGRSMSRAEPSSIIQDAQDPVEDPSMLDSHVSRSSTLLFDSELPSESREDGRRPHCSREGQSTHNESATTTMVYQEQPSFRYKISLSDATTLLVSQDFQKMSFDIRDVDFMALRIADVKPPVTTESLSYLDIVTILNNPQLRHDLNFDTDILFHPGRANVTPEHRNRDAAYWSALAFELALYMSLSDSTPSFSAGSTRATSSTTQLPDRNHPSTVILSFIQHNSIPARLPSLFHAMRALLKTLIRSDDWVIVEQVLDVDLLMQQLRRGACDLHALSGWLGAILKGSCSPVRDAEVERVTSLIRRAVQERDPEGLVTGLKGLFGVLEVMKLDVANHQIRFLRLLMLNDSLEWEQRYWLRRINDEDWDFLPPRRWFDQSISRQIALLPQPRLSNTSEADIHPSRRHRSSNTHSSNSNTGHNIPNQPLPTLPPLPILFSRAFIELVIDPSATLPATFERDFARIDGLRHEWCLLLRRQVLLRAFDALLRHMGYRGGIPDSARRELLERIEAVESGCSPPTSYTSSEASSDLSSPSSSPSSSSGPLAHDQQPRVQDTYPQNPVHIEILRAASGTLSQQHQSSHLSLSSQPQPLPQLPSETHLHLLPRLLNPTTQEGTPLFASARASLHTALQARVEAEVADIFDLSARAILERYKPLHPPLVSTPETQAAPETEPETREGEDGLLQERRNGDGAASPSSAALSSSNADGDRTDALARRIAHVAVLHWRVWSPILYLQPRELVYRSAAARRRQERGEEVQVQQAQAQGQHARLQQSTPTTQQNGGTASPVGPTLLQRATMAIATAEAPEAEAERNQLHGLHFDEQDFAYSFPEIEELEEPEGLEGDEGDWRMSLPTIDEGDESASGPEDEGTEIPAAMEKPCREDGSECG